MITQKNEIGFLSYTITKINFKCIKGLNMRPDTVKVLEENTVKKLPDIGLSNDFLIIPKYKQQKQK